MISLHQPRQYLLCVLVIFLLVYLTSTEYPDFYMCYFFYLGNKYTVQNARLSIFQLVAGEPV